MMDKTLSEYLLENIVEQTPANLAMESGMNMAMEALTMIREEKRQKQRRTPTYTG
jgi:hypothetical protein